MFSIEKLSPSVRRELRRALANGKYHFKGNDFFFPGSDLSVGGRFIHSVNGKDEQIAVVDPNTVSTEGLNYLLDGALGGATQITQWYVGLFKGNVTPALTWTGANWVATATELTEYNEANRVLWVPAAASGGVVTSAASKADFTINATVSCYGAALVESSTKSGTAGKLFSAARFASVRNLESSDVFSVGYEFTAANV